ncbi:YtpI family protein [Psychrobacillus sp.]|uniref:YtpI family protein n=1 Tax=Psychrobacillus sp. TaxID=1871623 RepID=UPI0028BD32CD|nr:YtpI family protein [Psychrobacillus sp.]
MILNGILVLGIIVSFVWYFYFKTKQLRTSFPIRKKWYAAKASLCLGALLVFFGFNYLIVYPSGLTYAVSALFVILGSYFMYHNYKAFKHYGQFVDEELSLNK